MSKVEYTIIVPALNEEDLIAKTLKSLREYLSKKKILEETEVIVVATKDKDNTGAIAKDLLKKFPNKKIIEPDFKVGKGRDVKLGMLAANGKYILFTDADLATPLHHIVPAFQILREGADVVIGKRDLPTIHTGFRKLISLSANLITRTLVAPGFSDTQCGFKAFNRKSAVLIFNRLRVQGWAFDMEVIAIARQNGLIINELLVNDWSEKKPAEKQLSGDSNIKAAFRTLGEAIKIGYGRLKGAYKE